MLEQLETLYRTNEDGFQEQSNKYKEATIKELQRRLQEALQQAGLADEFNDAEPHVRYGFSGDLLHVGLSITHPRYGELMAIAAPSCPCSKPNWTLRAYNCLLIVGDDKREANLHEPLAVGAKLASVIDAQVRSQRHRDQQDIENLRLCIPDLARNLEDLQAMQAELTERLGAERVDGAFDAAWERRRERQAQEDENQARRLAAAEKRLNYRAVCYEYEAERRAVLKRNAERIRCLQQKLSRPYQVATLTYALPVQDEDGAWQTDQETVNVLVQGGETDDDGYYRVITWRGIERKRFFNLVSIGEPREVLPEFDSPCRTMTFSGNYNLCMPPLLTPDEQAAIEATRASLEMVASYPDYMEFGLDYYESERVITEVAREFERSD